MESVCLGPKEIPLSGALIFYYINVESPNLNLTLGIGPKAGNLLIGKKEGEGEKDRLR
jgi:hypothetical protein